MGETVENIGIEFSCREVEISTSGADHRARRAASPDGLAPRQSVAYRPAMSRLENPSSTAMRCVFFASPR